MALREAPVILSEVSVILSETPVILSEAKNLKDPSSLSLLRMTKGQKSSGWKNIQWTPHKTA